ncbi:hypothetical protein [Acinetobacter sp. UBA1297]|uniref:hypothetical protein n=1 Tax=Acinetobacter sp. UBA1297 TaxID=1945925 RepID=UPI002580F1C7|nr:hypothetical protein [Acinetobacter sp. UBA1297]
MSLTCPYCLSDQVIQVVNQQVNGTESSGLAGAVIGGLFSSMFDEPKKPITMTYYHCNQCQQNFR